uniref:Integrase, catalytic region, zinc finger, CCHC-type, peptidase aspartic, catalytic n=1 Tax=Tanacetum cinerariifolium TaxID=118510 RepID=A0A699H544_TANCI|nr:hypothetical protein [Tanacetum cinerariifolium]
MTTLADKAILSGVDNRSPMLEKDMYDSWKSIMELYMMNRQHGRMILEFVENGPIIWPSIKENRVTRPKKYSELSATEAIQAYCDVKATNIILQGLPTEVYALVSNHKVANELWERIQLLMQGTSLTKQKRECKHYDEFDKFAYKKGETLHDLYLRFSMLLNDMNIYNMKLEQFQVNTKFLNTLPPEWSKFATDVKRVRDLHTTNIDQLHAYLGQHEFHANDVRLMHEQLSISTTSFTISISTVWFNLSVSSILKQSIINTSFNTHPSIDYQSSVHHNAYSPPSSIPQIAYAPTVNQQQQQPEFPSLDLGLTVLMFKQGDDPIDVINHMMSFLSGVVTSRYPTTNNRLRNSSNPRQQATINDGKITLKPVHGRKNSFDSGTSRTCTLRASGSNSGKQMTDSNCDEITTAKVALMANLSHYGSNALTKVHNPDNVDTNMINLAVQAMPSSKQSNVLNHSKTEITSDSNIISYSQYKAQQLEPKIYDGKVIEKTSAIVIPGSEETRMLAEESRSKMLLKQKDPMMLEKKVDTTPVDYVVLNQLYQDFEKRFVTQTELSTEQAFWSHNLVNSSDLTPSNRPTKVEVLKGLPKVSMVNTSLKKLKHHLAGFDVVVKERTTATTIIEGSWRFEHKKACFRDEIISFVKALKDLFNSFDQYLVDELSEVQKVFHQM